MPSRKRHLLIRRNAMYPFYLGIDLHLKRAYAALMNSKGTVIDERQEIRTLPNYIHIVEDYHSPMTRELGVC